MGCGYRGVCPGHRRPCGQPDQTGTGLGPCSAGSQVDGDFAVATSTRAEAVAAGFLQASAETTSTAEVTVAATTTATEPQRGRLVINAVGDVNVDPDYIPALLAEGYDHALSGMGGLFLDDDLTIINLECPASDLGAIVPKEFNFRCDVDALESFGDDVANQGNNHILDFGPEAMLDSLEQLRLADIAPVGAGANAARAAAAALFVRKA